HCMVQTLPGLQIVADYGRLSLFLKWPRSGGLGRLDPHCRPVGTNEKQSTRDKDDKWQSLSQNLVWQTHFAFCHRISFPITTPVATESTAPSTAGRSALATSRFNGASTVDFVPLLVSVKVMTVPSGTGLPRQSRTGSVSRVIRSFDGFALIFRLQGSPATC